ncbi:hypothetical protein EY777_09250 [Escherichia coli]|nr:hypothetical protein [Escherichia coli]
MLHQCASARPAIFQTKQHSLPLLLQFETNVYENEYPPQRNQDVTVAGIENLYSLTNQNSASSNIS